MKKRILYFIAIAMSLLSGNCVLAQGTPEHGREAVRAVANFRALADSYALHPEPFVLMARRNESDESIPVKAPMTDPAQIHTRPPMPSISGMGPVASLPVSPSPTDTFSSTLDPGTSIPPDTHGAVDSNYCMTTINTTVKIQTRAGGAVSSMTLNAFFNPVNSFGGTFDPRVHYDQYASRWIVVAVSGANNTLDSSSILIAVSQTSNPTGSWWMYKIRAYLPADYWFDYPDVGFNSKWITVTGNLFENSPGTGYNGCKVFAFDKAALYAGTSASYTSFTQATSSTIAPALTYHATLANMFMVESWNSFAGQMRLWKLSGAVGSEVMTSVGFPTNTNRWQSSNNIFSGTSGADFAPQAGTANRVQANDDRVTQLVYMNGRLWFAHTIFLPYSTSVNATRCSVQWWETDTFSAPIQIGRIDDATGANFYTFPSMAVNINNDALIGFSALSATTFPSAAYALRLNTDPVDSIRPLVVYRHGLAKYYKTFSGTKNRWGDYSGTCLDPLNQTDFWTLQEASNTPSGPNDRWDTWWAYVQICNPPTATITPGGPTSFCTGGSVLLTATSGAGFTYQWQLGGSNIAGATNISHTASVGGSYTVIVSDALACSATSSATTVTIVSPPAATITPGGPTSFCTGGSVVLTANSGAGFTYQWHIGGTNIPGATNISFTAFATGNYTVRVTNSTGCGTTSSITAVTVGVPPGATITPAGPTTFCSGGSVVLNANTGAGFTYQWRLAASPIAGATNSSFTASAGGSYTVIVTSSGCSSTSSATVVSVNSNPTATITPGGPTTFCSGGSVVLTANSGAGLTYQWRLGASPIAGATNVSHTASTGGSYTVVVTNSSSCSTTSSATTVVVNTTPPATITPAGPTTFCSGGSVVLNANTGAGFTYQWRLGASPIPAATNSSFTASASGSYTVIVTSSGCSATSSATVVIVNANPPATITPGGPTGFCTGGSVVLNANAGAGLTYQWQLGGSNISGATNVSHTASTGGNYTVIVTSAGCNTTSAITAVSVNPPPGATITPGGPTIFCTGDNVVLNANTGAGYTYQWQLGGSNIGGATNASFTASAAGNYTVIVTNISCSSTSAITTVTVSGGPGSTITPAGPTTFCTGGSVLLNANTGAGISYQWHLNTVSIVGATNASYSASSGGDYTVTTTLGSCIVTSAITTLTVISVSAAITPAGPTTFCSPGSVVLNATTGAGYTYQWQLGGTGITGATTSSFTATAAGSYTVIIANGPCSATSPATVVTVSPGPPATITPAGPTTFCAGGSVVLNANTGAGLTYQWQLGGTNITGATTSSYIATTAGDHTVIVTLGTCVSTSAITTITTNPAPGATITPAGPTTFCSSGSVLLNANTGAGYTYQWRLGVSPIAGATNDNFTATTGGNYSVIVTNGSCSSTSAGTTVVVNTMPLAVITPSGPTTFCAGGSVGLNASTGAGYTYQWELGGVAIPGATMSVHTVSTGGNYTVVVNSGACTATSPVVAVTVNSVTVAAITGATNVCAGQTIPMSDATPGGVWSSSNPSLATVSTSGVVAGISAGTVLISYSVTGTCGTAVATALVTVNPLPVIAATTGPSTVCTGQLITLANATPGGVWSSANTAIATVGTSGSVSGVSAGTVLISYTVTSSSGCTASVFSAITVITTPVASITPAGPTTFCTGGSVVLNATTTSGVSYQWQRGGANIPGAVTPSYTANTSGNYTVIVTGSCVSVSAPVVVTVNPGTIVVPSVNITSSPGPVFCLATSLATFTAAPLNGGSSPSYQWFVNGVVVGAGLSYAYTPAAGDIVRVVLTSNHPCAFPLTASHSVTISVSPIQTPSVSISSNPATVCSGDTITFSAVPVFGGTAPTYTWNQNGLNVASGPVYRYVPSNGDVLICNMTSNYPCVTTSVAASSALVVAVQPLLPNTITIFASKAIIAPGSLDTFIAVAPNAGTAPAYQWYIGGVAVAGATNAMYVTNTLLNGQEVSCIVSSSDPCARPRTKMSAGITIVVTPVGVKQISNADGKFTIVPNPNKGEFTIEGVLKSPGDELVRIVITNMLGQTVYTENARAQNGSVKTRIVLEPTIANGMYIVNITSGGDHVVFDVVIDR